MPQGARANTTSRGAFRLDLGSLRPAKKYDDGRIRADVYMTKPGVFPYLDPTYPSGVRLELREPEQVFDPKSMDSFAQIPVTNNHPPEMVTAKNARKYMVGATGESIERHDDHVRGTVMVADEAAAQDMRAGKLAASCGYTCDVEYTPGVHPLYGRYDAIQKNIRGNHLAIVTKARAGDSARIRMDAYGEDAAMREEDEERDNDEDDVVENDDESDGTDNDSSGPANKKRVDHRSHMATEKDEKNKESLLDAAAVQLSQATARADEAETQLADAVKRADTAEGEVASLRDRIKKLESERRDQADYDKLEQQLEQLKRQVARSEKARMDAEDPKRLSDAVKRRVAVESAALMALGIGRETFDGLSDRELMTAVVKKLHGVSIPADKSDDYVRARFDAAIEGFNKGAEALANLREVVETKPATRADSRSAREQMVARQQDAWKKPLNTQESK